MALISVQHLSKSFPGVRALHDVSFELDAGEVHALMGENGAGKSTLMKILAGVYTKDSGEIRYDGECVDFSSPREAQVAGIGIIHQELQLMNHLTVAENIFIGREPKKAFGLLLDDDKLNRQAAELLAHMNLALDPRANVGGLTVARQQMVEIAKALSFNSRVLIMDEPTAALNNAEIAELFKMIRELKARGVGIIYISHKMDELKQISDRVTVLRDGEYVATVPTESTAIETIIGMMVGRTLSDERVAGVAMAGEIALEVRNLNCGPLVRDVSFVLRKGEILGFAGLMGAGRTEVARAIFGADPLQSGDILVNGRKVSIRTPKHAVANGIGYLSEDRKRFGLATGMDVECNVVMSNLSKYLSMNFFLRKRTIRGTTRRFIGLLNIRTPSPAQQVRLLSGGNQQKIVVAKWLDRDCDILFFDEPTRGIDIGAKSEIYKLLRALADQGKAIVMISSELPEVLRMSDRIVVMCEGLITGELLAEQATQERIMQLATQRATQLMATQGKPRRQRDPMDNLELAQKDGLKADDYGWIDAFKRRLLGPAAMQKVLAFASLVLLLIYFSFASPAFMQTDNMINILQATAVNGVLAIASTFVIITAGIDLSVGTLMTFCAVVAGVFLTYWELPMWTGIVAAMVAGALSGSVSGILIAKMKIPPFIATLGMMLVLKGLSLVVSGDKPIYFSNTENFPVISQDSLLGEVLPGLPIPNAVLILFVMAILASVVLNRTSLGRYTFAIGSNEEAVRLSGVNVDRWKIIIYSLGGAICGVAGLLLASRINSAQPALGQGYELDAIAAVVIGGTSLSGGAGTILGTIIGAFIMSVLINGLRIMSVAQEWQFVVTGVIIILAVYADMLRHKRG